MSPAAAAFASACNAPGLLGTDTELVVTGFVVVVGAAARVVVWFALELPHPAAATTRSSMAGIGTNQFMPKVSNRAPEGRLNYEVRLAEKQDLRRERFTQSLGRRARSIRSLQEPRATARAAEAQRTSS
jgi:hypothetical protein